jgi:hypothetical protein
MRQQLEKERAGWSDELFDEDYAGPQKLDHRIR